MIEPTAESWVPVAKESDFPIQNLPYGVFAVAGGSPRVGVAIGDQILDLTALESTGVLSSEFFGSGTLEPLLARGRDTWAEMRGRLSELLETSSTHQDRVRPHLVNQNDAEMHLPCRIGNYVDFYSSIEHATNVGKILRPGIEPLPPNWRHMPIGYHGRAGTVVVDGTAVRRPRGQRAQGDFGPTRRLDFELELGFITGPGRSLGDPVPAIEAENHIFGLVLVNDWSARDIQTWEYQPLGPFLGKSFATTISPWVVPLEALQDFRIEPPVQDPPPLPYLAPAGHGLDLALEVTINDSVVARSNAKHLYWTMSQQLAHATSNGATFSPGDLFASGTVSGPDPDSRGCLLEITNNGETGSYLDNGDIVTIKGWAGGGGQPKLGLGLCRGQGSSAEAGRYPAHPAVPEPDLLSLVRVAGTAVPVAVAAIALDTSPGSIMSAAQELVASQRLTDTPAGYNLVDGGSVEVSPTMAAYLSGRLADAFAQSGGDPLVTGRLLITAGRPGDAWDVLGTAALDARVKRSDLEELALLDLALDALNRAHLEGGSRAADVHLQRARLLRSRGESAAARDAIETALPSLSGEHLVDGLGFAASIADDLQLPQEAERWVALAAMSAANLGLFAKLGSLLTFQGRELSRLGFASEAQAALSKGNALLETHGSEVQRFYGLLNRAWVDLDQGQMRNAELDFARLRELAEHLEGEASQADKEAYWARSLFGSGRPDLALEAIDRAVSLARRVKAVAPEFISAMARTEGGILYEQWEYAGEGARDTLEFAETTLLSWKNVGHYLTARALSGSGQREAALAELAAAQEATPEGSNGTRWRARIDALSLALGDTWDGHRAEDLTDLLLQSNWLGAAAELMITRAIREKDPDLAAEAAALAMEVGNPALAAQAIRAGQLWGDPLALPVVDALRSLKEHLPDGWDFMSDPSAEAALALKTEVGPDEMALLRARIEDALAAAGLSGDTILSPAQRRAGGQVRRRRRRRSPLQILAGAVAAAAIAVVSAIVVVNLTTEPVTVTTTTRPGPTTTAAPVLEETPVSVPESGLSGTALYRGDSGRSGISSGGFRKATGRYWLPRAPGGVFAADPIAFGRYLFVATDENFIYGIEQLNGRIISRSPTSTAIISEIAVDQPGGGESPPVLVFGGGDQFVHAYSALLDAPELWRHPTAGPVQAAPLIVDNNTVYIADTAGYLYAFDLAGGELLWQYPSEEAIEIDGPPEGTFVSAPAFANEIVYAVTQEGLVHMVNAGDGTPFCNPVNLMSGVFSNPVITGGAVFVGLASGGMSVFAADTCGAPPQGYATRYPIPERPVRLSPTITPEMMFYIDESRLIAAPLEASLWQDIGAGLPFVWPPFPTDQLITTPPVLADGVVYIGTQEGMVLALDAETGDKLWEFSVGAGVRGEPLVVPGAVFVGNANGEIWAIAGE